MLQHWIRDTSWYQYGERNLLLSTHLPMQSVPITTDVVSVQHYVIKFVSDLRQVGGFLRVLSFLTPIKLTAKI
jgi:hypothetical protein